MEGGAGSQLITKKGEVADETLTGYFPTKGCLARGKKKEEKKRKSVEEQLPSLYAREFWQACQLGEGPTCKKRKPG